MLCGQDAFIKELIDWDANDIIVFNRPEGFGKTTNLSMFDAFFNIKYKGNTWFDGLEVSKHPEYDKYKNAFPVIYLDLKGTESDTCEEFEKHMLDVILNVHEEHRYLLDCESLKPGEKEEFRMVLNKEEPEKWFQIFC